MKLSRLFVATLALLLAVAFSAQAQKEETKTLKGTICCAKCELKLPGQDSCATVIKVGTGAKAEIYYFDTASDKKYHPNICTEPKEGTVKGTVSTKDGKKMIKVTDVKYKE